MITKAVPIITIILGKFIVTFVAYGIRYRHRNRHYRRNTAPPKTQLSSLVPESSDIIMVANREPLIVAISIATLSDHSNSDRNNGD